MDSEWICEVFLEPFFIKVLIKIENNDSSKIIEIPMQTHTFYRFGAGFESRKL